MRELANVSVPALRHYFGDRDGVIAAAFGTLTTAGAHHQHRAATHNLDLPIAQSLRWVLDEFTTGWIRGVGPLVTAGIIVGANSGTLGPKFIDVMLEPTLQAFERRLIHHQEAGEIDAKADMRAASLALVSPVILGLMHQIQLGGST
ncbi:MAG: hypothetical protein GWP91_11280 [Rhodobacterales bacterium]|nr:hypothetical protein [Rhodobacterales bacterium]